jgi:hypothetical protein
MLMFFSSAPFYTSNVHFPDHNTPLSAAIHANLRFRFFDHCIGAVDGTHICACSSATSIFFFIYSLTGWDGSVADTSLWNDACSHDLCMPEHKYLLADAGFGTCDALLVPYRGVRYHLKEWRQANLA